MDFDFWSFLLGYSSGMLIGLTIAFVRFSRLLRFWKNNRPSVIIKDASGSVVESGYEIERREYGETSQNEEENVKFADELPKLAK